MAHQENPVNVPDPAQRLIVPKLHGTTMVNWQSARKQILQFWGFDIALNEEPMPAFRGNDTMPLSSHNAKILAKMAKTHPGQGRSVVAHLLQYCQQRRGQSLLQRAMPGTSREQISTWIRLKDLEQYSTLIIGFQHFELGNFGPPASDTALAVSTARALTELTGSTMTLSRPSFEESDAGGHVNSLDQGQAESNDVFDTVTGWHKDPTVVFRVRIPTAAEGLPEALSNLLSRLTHKIAEKRGLSAQGASQAASNFRRSASDIVSSVQSLVEQALQTASSNDGQLAHHSSIETTEHGTPTDQPLSETRQYIGLMSRDRLDKDALPLAQVPATTTQIDGSKRQKIIHNWGLDVTSMDYPMSMFRPNEEPATTKIVEGFVTLSARFPGRGRAVVAALLEYAAERHASGRRRRPSEHVTGRDMAEFCSVCGEDDQYAMGNFAVDESEIDAGQSALQRDDGGIHMEYTSGDHNPFGVFRADDPTSVSTAMSVLSRHQNTYSGHGYQPLRPAPAGYHYADPIKSTYQPIDPTLSTYHPTKPTIATSAEEQSGNTIGLEQASRHESRKRRRIDQLTDTDMMNDAPEQDTLKSRLRPR